MNNEMNDAADRFDCADARLQAGRTGGHRARSLINMTAAASAVSAGAHRILVWAAPRRRRLKQIALLAALTLFCGGLVFSVQAHPDILGRIRIGPLLVILLVILPAGLAVSAMDFQILARLSGAVVKFWPAVEITIYTRAANMLPIPGSMAVRMAALKSHGVTLRRGGGVMLLFTAIWGGAGFCYSAAWLAAQAPAVFSATFLAIGVAILAASALAVRRFRLDPRFVSLSAGLRFALIALEAFTLMMAMRAIGVDAGYHQTAILVVASFLASVAPAGLGVRETIIAILAPVAGIDPAAGFLAGAAARFVSMAFLAACSIIAFFINRGRG